jgi:hypothetical protein
VFSVILTFLADPDGRRTARRPSSDCPRPVGRAAGVYSGGGAADPELASGFARVAAWQILLFLINGPSSS